MKVRNCHPHHRFIVYPSIQLQHTKIQMCLLDEYTTCGQVLNSKRKDDT